MKIKLNKKQIENIRRELKETERRGFETDDVSHVFRMLQYWAKSVGVGEAKIQSVAELPDGYLCRVNSKFRESMKAFLKRVRERRLEKGVQLKKEKEMQATAEKYDQLIKESKELNNHPKAPSESA